MIHSLSAALTCVGPQSEFSRFGLNAKAQEQISQISSPECCDLARTRVSGSSAMRLHFVPIHIFRETPSVAFFDAGIAGANGVDVVVHRGSAISPPNDEDFEQYYVHQHQVDHNLVLQGGRTYTLLNPDWPQPHHVIHLQRVMGALQIPIGTYHRSISGEEGSLVLNQSFRDDDFDYSTEFIPVSLRARADLQLLRKVRPWIWSWKNGHIQRSHKP